LEEFYEELDKYEKECKDHEVNIIMGDFNAKVVRGKHTGVVGSEGIRVMNGRGEKLTEWCEQSDEFISFHRYSFHFWPPCFCMTISKKIVSPKCELDIDGVKIKQVETFEFLGSLVTSDAKSDQELKQREQTDRSVVCEVFLVSLLENQCDERSVVFSC